MSAYECACTRTHAHTRTSALPATHRQMYILSNFQQRSDFFRFWKTVNNANVINPFFVGHARISLVVIQRKCAVPRMRFDARPVEFAQVSHVIRTTSRLDEEGKRNHQAD